MSAHAIPNQQPSAGVVLDVPGLGMVDLRRGSQGQLIALCRGVDGRLDAVTAEQHDDEVQGLLNAFDRRIRTLQAFADAVDVLDPVRLPPAGAPGAQP